MKTYLECPICNTSLQTHISPWCKRCPSCDFLVSDLTPAIDLLPTLDEDQREEGLRKLRKENFQKIIAQLLLLRPKSSSTTLLECGSGHGWFLEEAQKANFIALGIEPSVLMTNKPQTSHLQVRRGYFPEALNPEEKFDIICFNDVFEHIPDLKNLMAACSHHLNPNGLLLINLPNSKGFFYRVATFLAQFHFKYFFERLWQKDFPSPHLYYFSPLNLRRFAQNHGFRSVKTLPLTSLKSQGLWARLRTDKNSPFLSSLVIFPILIFILPLISMLPSDIHCEFFEKEKL